MYRECTAEIWQYAATLFFALKWVDGWTNSRRKPELLAAAVEVDHPSRLPHSRTRGDSLLCGTEQLPSAGSAVLFPECICRMIP